MSRSGDSSGWVGSHVGFRVGVHVRVQVGDNVGVQVESHVGGGSHNTLQLIRINVPSTKQLH